MAASSTYFSDGVVEVDDDERSEHRSPQVDEQPRETARHRLVPVRAQLFFRAHTTHPQHVLGLLFLEHVDHVIPRDLAEQHSGFTDDGNCRKVVARDDARHLFLVFFGTYGCGGILDQIRERCLGRCENKLLQGQRADEPVVLIDDEHNEQLAADLARLRAHILDRLPLHSC